uniref:Lysophosphatidylcholine acyltransferase 4 n=1 Tax=Oryzias latipes TaxID=8090 RepID=H2LYK3_ORYLA
METRRCSSAAQDCAHPFIHEVKLSAAQRIKGGLLGCILFPLRVALAVLFFLIMWPLARLRLAGLSEEERAKPVTGWRRWLFHPPIWLLSRAVFFSLGFLWVRVKGRRADLREAPVLVVAPHSGFFDMLVLCPTQLATVVSRSENTSLPVIGALLEFNQSVLVSRKDPESRKKAVAQLIQRLTSDGYWPQMLMFPEGTTTNGRSLIKFKPGVSVEPPLISMTRAAFQFASNDNEACRLTSPLLLLFYFSLQFLPVYKPSEEEKKDPNLYADNVQKLMAGALGVPATDYVMEGRVPVSKLGGLSLPLESPARDALKELLGEHEIQAAIDRIIDRCGEDTEGSTVSVEELASLLGLRDRQAAVHLCSLYSKGESVDLRQLGLSVLALSGLKDFGSLLHSAFTLFDREHRGSLSAQQLSDLMGALLGVPQQDTTALYTEACSGGPLTEEKLLRVLAQHQTYRKVKEFLESSEASVTLPKAKGVNNNNGLSVIRDTSPPHNKKQE